MYRTKAVKLTFFKVSGRVLPSPSLVYNLKSAQGQSSTTSVVADAKGSWNLRDQRFVETKQLNSWAIVALCQSNAFDERYAKSFGDALVEV